MEESNAPKQSVNPRPQTTPLLLACDGMVAIRQPGGKPAVGGVVRGRPYSVCFGAFGSLLSTRIIEQNDEFRQRHTIRPSRTKCIFRAGICGLCLRCTNPKTDDWNPAHCNSPGNPWQGSMLRLYRVQRYKYGCTVVVRGVDPTGVLSAPPQKNTAVPITVKLTLKSTSYVWFWVMSCFIDVNNLVYGF